MQELFYSNTIARAVDVLIRSENGEFGVDELTQELKLPSEEVGKALLHLLRFDIIKITSVSIDRESGITKILTDIYKELEKIEDKSSS